MCLRKIPTRLRYNQAGILRGHTWESLKHYFKTVELDKIELAREGREPTREFHYTKFGLESRERSIGAAGVTLSPINPPLHQTKQTGRRHPGNELTFSSFVESEKRCHRLGRRPFVEEIGGVKLRPHGGLISRRGTDILPQIFLLLGSRSLATRSGICHKVAGQPLPTLLLAVLRVDTAGLSIWSASGSNGTNSTR